MTYDSTKDTQEHIKRVATLLKEFSVELNKRGKVHDASKLVSPEKELFDIHTPLLSSLKYGTDEYRESLCKLKIALDNHYAMNSHHPEHYANGIDGMTLLDVVEMFFDWKAATERNKDGNIFTSIDKNKDRFKMSDQLFSIFKNTANKLFS